MGGRLPFFDEANAIRTQNNANVITEQTHYYPIHIETNKIWWRVNDGNRIDNPTWDTDLTTAPHNKDIIVVYPDC